MVSVILLPPPSALPAQFCSPQSSAVAGSAHLVKQENSGGELNFSPRRCLKTIAGCLGEANWSLQAFHPRKADSTGSRDLCLTTIGIVSQEVGAKAIYVDLIGQRDALLSLRNRIAIGFSSTKRFVYKKPSLTK